MKVLILVEVDPDFVLDAYKEGRNQDESPTLETAIEGELGWVELSGITVKEVLLPDNPIFITEGFDLEKEIREIMK